MPNWCYNNAEFTHSNKEVVDRVESFLNDSKDKKDYALFQYLFPRPEDQEENWYEWNIEHWGTKWDAGIHDWWRSNDNTLQLSFDTAWSPPIALYEHMVSEGWEVTALYEEPGMAYAGKYEDGEDLCFEYDIEDEESLADIPEDVAEFAALWERRADYLEEQDDEEYIIDDELEDGK